jgi:GntR family transcriptional regulator/MocR family aminotransferase
MDMLFELGLSAAPKASRGQSSSLYGQLKSAILEGRLKPGVRLPATRSAPSLFGLSRNGAQAVYDRLRQEGLVSAQHGSGTYVADPLPMVPEEHPSQVAEAPDPRLNPFWLSSETSAWISFWGEARQASQHNSPHIDLRPGLVDPTLFPFAAFRQVLARQLRRLETRRSFSKSPQGNQGNFHLRHAIAHHVSLTRAVGCSAEDVLVTSGAQQAFDLIARAMVKPGKTVVAVEDPGYPPMRTPFAATGARLVPVRVDAHGLVVSEIPRDAAIICVCPSHQFPLGVLMSPARRRELLQFAALTGAVIVEDDYDSEFRYGGSPIDALRNAGSADQVFYVGSFSKCMLPSLRLGFIVPPRWAMATLVAAKNALDWHCSVPLQMAVAEFIAKGHLSRHVRRLRRIYRERRDHVVARLTEKLGNVMQPIPSFYGMHVAALATGEIGCEAISDALAGRGIQVHALDRYYLQSVERTGFVLSYASANTKALAVAIDTLAQEVVRLEAEKTHNSRHGGTAIELEGVHD